MSYSHDINLDTWVDLVGNEPAAGVDSLGHYRGHALDEGSAATFTVSPTYTAGTELTLKLHESTDSISKAHQWEASVKLNGGTPEVFTGEFTSPAVTDTFTYRSITISTSGEIDLVAIVGGDVVEVTLTRIAATSNEDSADIRLYAVAASETLADATVGGCAGRVGKIVDYVMDFSKEVYSEGLTPTRVLSWINDCNDELAQDGVWPYYTTIDVTASTESYDLVSLISDFVGLTGLIWTTTGEPITPISERDLQTYRLYRTSPIYTTTTRPVRYSLRGDLLFLFPNPTVASVGALGVKYKRHPGELGCTENFEPDFPAAYDTVFKEYCLWKHWSRDTGSKAKTQKIQEHFSAYRQAKTKLLIRSIEQRGIRPAVGR